MKKRIAIILILLQLALLGTPALASQKRDIAVKIDGTPLVFDVPPAILSQRVLVPLRAISEALGAIVSRQKDGLIIITKDTRTVALRINQKYAYIDGIKTTLDVSTRLVTGRTLVPLRFIGEAFGATVNWNPVSQTVTILSPNPQTVRNQDNNISTPDGKVEITSITGQRLYIGMETEALQSILGVPDRKEITFHGYDWWVYPEIPGGLLLVGIADNKVVAFYTDSPSWTISGISPSDSFKTLSALHTLSENVSFHFEQSDFTVLLGSEDLLERPIVVINNQAVTFFLDTPRDKEISAIRIMDLKSFLATGGYSLRWRGKWSNLRIPALSLTQQQLAFYGQERIMLDLVNSFRIKNGLKALLWQEELAVVARKHSSDMYNNNFFNHNSPTTGTPADRIRQANIIYLQMGENLAAGTFDSIIHHYALVNSPGHRTNLLNPNFTHVGIGVVGMYYTQKFLR